MTEYRITATHSPNLTDDDINKRLGRVYTLILTFSAQRQAADGSELGEQIRAAESDSLALEPDSCEVV
jgi:hypothetical protein